jgi:hypothetical protein
MAPGLTQPLTEMSTRDLPGGKGRPTHKADNLTTICEPMSRKCGSLDTSQPYGPPQHVIGIALPSQYFRNYTLFTVSLLSTSIHQYETQQCMHFSSDNDDILISSPVRKTWIISEASKSMGNLQDDSLMELLTYQEWSVQSEASSCSWWHVMNCHRVKEE